MRFDLTGGDWSKPTDRVRFLACFQWAGAVQAVRTCARPSRAVTFVSAAGRAIHSHGAATTQRIRAAVSVQRHAATLAVHTNVLSFAIPVPVLLVREWLSSNVAALGTNGQFVAELSAPFGLDN